MRASRRYAILPVFVAVTLNSFAAEDPDSKAKKVAACVAQMNERTAATVTEDWVELERLSTKYATVCKGIFGAEDDSSPYEGMALANVKLKRPQKALLAANTCVQIYYSNFGCHVWRLEALVALSRFREAQASIDQVERLLIHLTEIDERNLRNAQSIQEAELIRANMTNLAAKKAQVSAIRRLYFPEQIK